MQQAAETYDGGWGQRSRQRDGMSITQRDTGHWFDPRRAEERTLDRSSKMRWTREPLRHGRERKDRERALALHSRNREAEEGEGEGEDEVCCPVPC